MITVGETRSVFYLVLLASLGVSIEAAGQSSTPHQCPDRNGTCASFGQDRMTCVEQGSQNVCVAPSGAEMCSDGQTCSVGAVCGKIRLCSPEENRRFFPCYRPGLPVVYDGEAGGPCKFVDDRGVTHMCKSARCSADSPSMCLANPPLMLSDSPGG